MGGPSGLIGSLFGGGGMPEPEPVKYESLPTAEAGEPEAEAVRDAEARRNRARAQGVRSTLLSNPLGGSGSASNPAGLLGRGGMQ